MKKIIFLCVCLHISFSCYSQVNDSIIQSYKFLKLNENIIGNDSVGLNTFYENLLKLENKENDKVSVVHVGDSHIQADFFSGKVRQNLQLTYGNAGRGLIFPYKIARTNEPYSFQSWSNVKWRVRRNVLNNDSLPVGISGITINTIDTGSVIKIKVLDQPGLNYAFNKVTLFHDKGPKAFDFVVCDDQNCVIGFINSNLKINSPFLSTEEFKTPVSEILLSTYKRDSSEQNSAQLYGIELQNGQAGVLYHTIGVNGAEYRHYNSSQYFVEQMTVLNPDLVIVSMGTNEAYASSFNPGVFIGQVDSLIKTIKQVNPSANILLTTPSDSFKRKKYKNPNLPKAREVIISYCKANNLAYWDLFKVMGGYGSIAKWFSKGLVVKDKLHFNRRGYELQGDLLFYALKNGYDKFKRDRLSKS